MVRVAGYFCVIALIGMAVNSRGGMASCITTAGFGIMLAVVCGNLQLARLPKGTTWKVVLMIVLVLGPFSYLVQSLQVARSYRGKVSAIGMIEKSIEVAMHPRRVQGMTKYIISEGKRWGWDEYYLGNPLLNRFANVKFHDLGLIDIARYGPQQRQILAQYSLSGAFASLPGPVIKLFGIPANKEVVTGMSNGDLMHALVPGVPPVGKWKTGSMIAHGLAVFGPAFLLVVAVAAVILFNLADSFAIRRFPWAAGFVRPPVLFAPVALISITQIVMLFADESLIGFAEFMIRGFVQMIVLYLVVYGCTKQVFRPQPVRRLSSARTLVTR
jgi:hypothetical protein